MERSEQETAGLMDSSVPRSARMAPPRTDAPPPTAIPTPDCLPSTRASPNIRARKQNMRYKQGYFYSSRVSPLTTRRRFLIVLK